MDDAQLDKLEALARAATPGPWANWGRHVIPEAHWERKLGGSTNKEIDRDDYAHLICLVSGKYQPDEANAAYIAAANPQTILALIAQARAAQPESATGTTGAIHSDDDELLELPKQPEELRARWKCEDCDGRGHDGESHWQGHFQPPEPAKCSACDGSGWVDVVALLPEQVIDAQRKARDYQKKVDWKIIDRRDAEIADLRAQLAAKGQGDAVAKMSTFQVRVDAENLNSGARKFTVRMAPASAQPAEGTPQAELLSEIGRAFDLLADTKMTTSTYVSVTNTLHHCRDALTGRGYFGAQPDRGAAQGDDCDHSYCKASEQCPECGEAKQSTSPASQPVAPETAQGDALHWPHDPTETACSSCGLTMGESRLLHDLKRGEMVAVAPSDAKGKAGAANAGKPPLPPADQHTAIGARLFLVSTLCSYGTACFQAGEQYARQQVQSPATSAANAGGQVPAAARKAAERIDAMHKGVVGTLAAIRAEHAPATSATDAKDAALIEAVRMDIIDFLRASMDDDCANRVEEFMTAQVIARNIEFAAMAAAPSSEKGGA